MRSPTLYSQQEAFVRNVAETVSSKLKEGPQFIAVFTARVAVQLPLLLQPNSDVFEEHSLMCPFRASKDVQTDKAASQVSVQEYVRKISVV